MDVNLLDMLKKVLGSDFGRLVSQYLGEPEGATQSSIDALLPAVLGGVAQKGSTPEGASSLLSMLKGLDIDTGLLDNVSGLFSGGAAGADSLVNTGMSLVKSLFGEKSDSLANALASTGGIKSGSASKLLALVVPLVLGFLKRFIGEKGLDASSLASLLAGQGDYLKGALDSRLTSALGFSSPSAFLGGPAQPAAARPAAAYTAEPLPAKKKSWLPWLLAGLGLLAALLLWQFFKQPTVAPVAQMPAPPAAVVTECGFPAKIYFEVGQAVVGPEGIRVIKEAAACIKEKGLKVSLTGYTDKTGDVEKNLELAKNRAKAVQDALVAEGLAVEVITLKPPMFHAFTGPTGSGADAEARRVEINKSVIVR
jgi:outer membrane protein OmpA-like peptidoglycan-associated protein